METKITLRTIRIATIMAIGFTILILILTDTNI